MIPFALGSMPCSAPLPSDEDGRDVLPDGTEQPHAALASPVVDGCLVEGPIRALLKPLGVQARYDRNDR